MWNAVIAGTTAAVIAGSSLVLAQQIPDRDGDQPAAVIAGSRLVVAQQVADRDGDQRWHPSAEDRSAFTDARIAALKAGLKLTPEQEKNWPTFEAAIRDMSKARADRLAAREKEQPPADPVERLHRRADALGAAAASLKKLADAEDPLYKSLDDAQKGRFQILAQALRPHQQNRFAGWQGRGQFGQDGRGQDGGRRCDRSERGGPNIDL
jgi:zinc resistance-associated protein